MPITWKGKHPSVPFFGSRPGLGSGYCMALIFKLEYQLLSTDLTNLFKVGIQYDDLTCVIVIVTPPCKVRLTLRPFHLILRLTVKKLGMLRELSENYSVLVHTCWSTLVNFLTFFYFCLFSFDVKFQLFFY